ncbi:MAG: T9SS C-terminal target domain-containing protein [Calditrichaeota bacterium]|nr:MAG: T9SS C-terminal target domain-containing protein [Calditrichota bacterium]
MKKIIFTTLAIFTFAASSFAQQVYSFTMVSDANFSFAQPWELVEIHADMTNLTSQPQYIVFDRVTENLPDPFWSSSVCAGINCWAPFVGTDTIYLAPDTTLDIRMNITPSTVQGQADIVVEFWDANSPNDKVVQDYHVSTEEVTVSVEEGEVILPSFKLAQNFPNPFNPSTKIELTVDKTDFGKLSVFNVLGQEIKVLASQKFTAGQNYTFAWDGKDANDSPVASGVYFYSFDLNGISQTKRMVLAK